MKRLFLNLSSLVFILMVCLFTLNVNAQEGKENEQVYASGDPPSFPGGDEALSKYLAENIIYPQDAKEKGIKGKVYVEFVINSEGAVTDVKVIRGSGNNSLDEEAVRVFKNMPKWIPAKKHGKTVSAKMTYPVEFKLNKNKKLNDKSGMIYEKVDEPAKFPGGEEKLSEFLRTNIKYPNSAKEDGVQGKVYLEFVVEKDGSISNIKLIRGLQDDCDQESIRVVKLMPKWEPGKLKGEVVRVKFTLPIVFQLR